MPGPRLLLVVNWLCVLAYAVWVVVRPGLEVGPTHPQSLIYNAAHVCALVALVSRAVRIPYERAGWSFIAAGVALYFAGDLYWVVELSGQADPPVPSPADALYLAFSPLMYVGVVLLARARFGSLPGRPLLDGLIATLATAAVGAAVLLPSVVASTDEKPLTAATNLAYPLLDLILLAVVVGAFVLVDFRIGRTWALLGLGLAVFAACDLLYLAQNAAGTYVENAAGDIGWIAATALIALAAWQPAKTRPVGERARWTIAVVPGVAGLALLGLLALDHLRPLDGTAFALTMGTGALLLVRYVVDMADGSRRLATSRAEATTDALTGLGNRRALTADLDRVFGRHGPAGEVTLALFDLDGFKAYNDRFGHPAGDALLVRLGERLALAVADDGRAYRLGGDEFCLVLRRRGPRALAAAGAALTAERDGVRVAASAGVVHLPAEAAHPTAALRLADVRLYDEKHARLAAGLRVERGAADGAGARAA